MDKLGPFSVGLATAVTFVIINALCAAAVALWPDATLDVFNSFAHGLDLKPLKSTGPLDLGRFLVGLISLAYCLQVELGWRLSQSTLGQQRRAQWTVTNRVSLFWCGQQVFQDGGYDWRDWLAALWAQLSAPEPAAAIELAA